MSARLLTAVEVAERLNVTRATVYHLCAKPDGLKSYKVGSLVRFKPEDVDEYVERRLVCPPQRKERLCTEKIRYKPGMKVVSL